MEYRLRSTGEIKTRREILDLYKNISIPAEWNSNVCDFLNIDPIVLQDQPSVTEYEKAELGDVIQLDDGSWSRSWNIVSIFNAYTDNNGVTHTIEELKEKYEQKKMTNKISELRQKRNLLLAETDWTALSDVSMTAEMAVYRQALRDITEQAGFPNTVNWPTKP